MSLLLLLFTRISYGDHFSVNEVLELEESLKSIRKEIDDVKNNTERAVVEKNLIVEESEASWKKFVLEMVFFKQDNDMRNKQVIHSDS